MKIRRMNLVVALISVSMAIGSCAAWAQAGATILKADDARSLIPQRVFYRGQTASTQIRNSGGIKFQDGYFVLASLVDTGGYSTGIAAIYQAYLIAEVPIQIEGKPLAAGAYGIGFSEDGKMVVTDLGAHNVLAVNTTTDSGMKHPLPLQFVADGASYRLYAGRNYVTLHR